MIKFVNTPTRLNQFFKQILAMGKQPITDSCLIKFNSEGAEVDCALASDTIIFGRYGKNFFITNETPQEEFFMATTTLIKDRLAYGFKGEKITFSTDADRVYLQGEASDDKVSEKLTAINTEKSSPFKVRLTPIGLQPIRPKSKGSKETEDMPWNVQALITTDRFSDLPPIETVEFNFDGKNLSMNLVDELGDRSRPIPVKKFASENKPSNEIVGTPLQVSFNLKVIQQLIANFEGEVWLSINEGMLTFAQTNNDYSLTYLFTAYSK